jgi:hypothetical protein
MNKSPKIGMVASSTEQLIILRQGEEISLRKGDAVLAGDVIQNKDNIPINIELPAQGIDQADSLITLAPGSSTAVNLQAVNGQPTIEVSPLTGGVELYATSPGTDGAILLAESGGELSGLVGTGLLSAGSLGSMAGVATAIGGGVGVAALATSSGDDINTSGNTFTDVRVDNPDNTGNQPPAMEGENSEQPPTGPQQPTDPEEPPVPSEPEQPGTGTTPPPDSAESGTTGTLLDVVLDPLANLLGSTPLAVITDPVFELLGSLPIGSATNPAQALPLDSISNSLPG